MSDTNLITIKRGKLQKLVNYFFEACSLCDEMNIYEFPEGDEHMQEMKSWVSLNFGRGLENSEN